MRGGGYVKYHVISSLPPPFSFVIVSYKCNYFRFHRLSLQVLSLINDGSSHDMQDNGRALRMVTCCTQVREYLTYLSLLH